MLSQKLLALNILSLCLETLHVFERVNYLYILSHFEVLMERVEAVISTLCNLFVPGFSSGNSIFEVNYFAIKT